MSLIPRNFYLDDIFDDFHRVSNTSNDMKCDVYEKEGNFVIELDIPGFDKKDITIECDNNVLTVTAEKNSEGTEEDKDKNYIRRERIYGKVSRTFNFNDIDEDAIKAEFNNGILKLTVPKLQRDNTKKVIEID